MEPSGHRGVSEYPGRVKYLLGLFALLILQGCDEKREVYSRFLTNEKLSVTCVALERSSPYFDLLKKRVKAAGFSYRQECPFRLKVFKNFSACRSEESLRISRGFMRLELGASGRTLYQVQQEFKDESDEALVATLLETMAKELTPP